MHRWCVSSRRRRVTGTQPNHSHIRTHRKHMGGERERDREGERRRGRGGERSVPTCARVHTQHTQIRMQHTNTDPSMMEAKTDAAALLARMGRFDEAVAMCDGVLVCVCVCVRARAHARACVCMRACARMRVRVLSRVMCYATQRTTCDDITNAAHILGPRLGPTCFDHMCIHTHTLRCRLVTPGMPTHGST